MEILPNFIIKSSILLLYLLLFLVSSSICQNEAVDDQQRLICDRDFTREECMLTCGCYLCSVTDEKDGTVDVTCMYPNTGEECKDGTYENTETINAPHCNKRYRTILLFITGFGGITGITLLVMGCIGMKKIIRSSNSITYRSVSSKDNDTIVGIIEDKELYVERMSLQTSIKESIFKKCINYKEKKDDVIIDDNNTSINMNSLSPYHHHHHNPPTTTAVVSSFLINNGQDSHEL